MILPIFLTTQFLSVKLDGKKPEHKLVNLRPIIDPFMPVISTSRVREVLKDLLKEDELTDVSPVILSVAPDNYDLDLGYDFTDLLSSIQFPLIVPEYYYSKAIDYLSPAAANMFLTCRKYGLEIPTDIKIQIDSIALSLYAKDNVGKFIGQDQIIISTVDVADDFKSEYVEAMNKALSDNIQIAGIWKIFIDYDYVLFPELIDSLEREVPIEEFIDEFINEVHAKLILAPGVKEINIGENESFETIELTDQHLNKIKIGEEDKITFKWKSDKSKFEGEIYGSKTGIRIDVRERAKG